MIKKDLQFIDQALKHPWMFYVYFWKWPRIVRQACAEYALLAKERDAAKEAHEQAVRANKIVRDWIHVTHRLDMTADMRAIWTAGKRLSALLLFLAIALSASAQLPPILRNQWTTNANPLALKVISTNGVRVATNVWELDFTNTATVTVSAVSNASKVMVSFTGSGSGSSSMTNALLHAGPTNGSVGALVLTAGDGVTLTTSGTNRVVAVSNSIVVGSGLWTNFNYAAAQGRIVGIADVNSNGVAVASFAENNITLAGEQSALISLGPFTGTPAVDGFSSANVFNIGSYAGFNQTLTNCYAVFNFGPESGGNQKVTNSQSLMNLGNQSGSSQKISDSLATVNVGGAGGLQFLVSAHYVMNIGHECGFSQSLNTADYIFNCGHLCGANASTILSSYINNFGYNSGGYLSASNANYVFNFGYQAGGGGSGAGANITNSRSIFNYGYGAGQKQMLLASTNIYNYGTYSGSNQVSSAANRVYAYGAYSGAISAITNSSDIYGFGTYSFRDAHINDSTNLFGVGIDTFEHALLTNSHNITAIGFETLENAKLTNSIDIIAIGNRSGLSGSGLEDIIILGNDVSSALSHQVVLGSADQTNLIQGSLQVTSGTLGAGKVLTDVNGDGFATWQTPTGGGGATNAIGSIYTNNVLAGGPGLTELEFTNTATVTWAATTNAGRVTMSATSAGGGSGIATNEGTGFKTTFYGQTNFGNITFTNGARIEQPTATITRFTNSTFDFGGNMTFTPNGTYEIGSSGGGSPSHIYSANGMTTENYLFGRNKGGFYWIGDGVIRISDNAGTSFGRLQFGGTGAAHPSLKRTAAGLELVGADGVGTSSNNLAIAGSLSVTNSTTLANVTADRVAVFNSAKQLTNSAAVDTTELETLDGVTSAIQTQLDGKQAGSATLTNLAATKAFTNVTRTVITNVGVSLYTVPAGCKYIYVECIGGGGGGGGVDGAASQSAAGGGGGSGAYCTTNIVNPAASYIVTVGTNGLGGAAAAGVNNGTIGGTTLFTNILTALGGSGGSGDASAAAVGFAIGGAGALETATGYIYSGGSPGQHGICMSGTLAVSGGGAGSIFGGGGAPQTAAAGANATGKGAGGSGAAATTNVDRAGGNGSPGMIMIREYYQ